MYRGIIYTVQRHSTPFKYMSLLSSNITEMGESGRCNNMSNPAGSIKCLWSTRSHVVGLWGRQRRRGSPLSLPYCSGPCWWPWPPENRRGCIHKLYSLTGWPVQWGREEREERESECVCVCACTCREELFSFFPSLRCLRVTYLSIYMKVWMYVWSTWYYLCVYIYFFGVCIHVYA